MNSDCAFRMGKSHTVCQDYAVARGGAPAYVLVADGCSSSPDTDIGARLLVKSAEMRVDRLVDALSSDPMTALEEYHALTLGGARAHVKRLGLMRESLDATLLTVVSDASRWLAAIYGDGVLAAKRKDGALQITSIAFAGNAPRYLNYRGDVERMRAFSSLSNNARIIDRFMISAEGCICGEIAHEDAGEAPYRIMGDCSGYDWIAALSDGAGSFTFRDGVTGQSERVTLAGVLSELLDFKNTTGLFVQRRIQKFTRLLEPRGRQHHDDLALAVIAFGGEP